jgi:hypothetical protein
MDENKAPDQPQDDSGQMTFDQNEINVAAVTEDNDLLQIQRDHLRERCILLRAAVNRVTEENRQLKALMEGGQLSIAPVVPMDRQPKRKGAAKKTATKKTTKK